MAKRRNAADVGKPPSKKKLSTEVTKIANAITGVAKNPLAEKRKPKPAVTKPKLTKGEPITTTNADPSSTAISTTPNFIIGPPPPTMSNLQPITTKISAAYGASGATGVTKDRKSNHTQSPPNQQKKTNEKSVALSSSIVEKRRGLEDDILGYDMDCCCRKEKPARLSGEADDTL